jgi:ER membrane protein complex subunit 2
MTDVASALQRLATYRTQNNRASQDTFDKGFVILKSNVSNNMGEDGVSHISMVCQRATQAIFSGWAFLEQLALAAIDVGRIDVADVCVVLHSY